MLSDESPNMTSNTEPSIKRLEELADLLLSKGLTRLDVSFGEQKIVLERQAPKPYDQYALNQTKALQEGFGMVVAGAQHVGCAGVDAGFSTSLFAPGAANASVPASAQGAATAHSSSEPFKASDTAEPLAGATKAGTTVRTPLLGIAYRAKEPGAPAFVELGAHVCAGDVLCLIEAMKMFNEITAPVDGEVTDILFADGDMVEYNAPLFVIA
jgi:acetyl-CoA carboxylase biotin carboxyl carrier protein